MGIEELTALRIGGLNPVNVLINWFNGGKADDDNYLIALDYLRVLNERGIKAKRPLAWDSEHAYFEIDELAPGDDQLVEGLAAVWLYKHRGGGIIAVQYP